MSGATPGTYTITAGVDDSCGVCGQTQTKTITVAKCDCEIVCACPTLGVTGPAGVTAPGETMTFTANVSGGSGEAVTYNWDVSSGTIVEGQGTPVIKVATTPEMAGGNVTATVTIGGICQDCTDNKRSETGSIASIPVNQEIDDFGRNQTTRLRVVWITSSRFCKTILQLKVLSLTMEPIKMLQNVRNSSVTILFSEVRILVGLHS